MKINRREIKETAKTYLKKPFAKELILATLIYFAIITFGGYLPVIGFCASLFGVVLMCNLEEYYYDTRMSGQVLPVGNIFSFKNTWRILLGKLWSTLKIWPAYLCWFGGAVLMCIGAFVATFAFAQEVEGPAILGLFIGIAGYATMMATIPIALVLSLNYVLTTYIILDNPEMKELEATNISKQMMKGHKWEWFVMTLSFIGWDLLTSLTFGILSIYTIPYKYQTFLGYYQAYKDAQPCVN